MTMRGGTKGGGGTGEWLQGSENWIMLEEEEKTREDWTEVESRKHAQNNIMIIKIFKDV